MTAKSQLVLQPLDAGLADQNFYLLSIIYLLVLSKRSSNVVATLSTNTNMLETSSDTESNISSNTEELCPKDETIKLKLH